MDRAVFDIFNKTTFLLKHFRPKFLYVSIKTKNSNQLFNGFVKNVSETVFEYFWMELFVGTIWKPKIVYL